MHWSSVLSPFTALAGTTHRRSLEYSALEAGAHHFASCVTPSSPSRSPCCATGAPSHRRLPFPSPSLPLAPLTPSRGGSAPRSPRREPGRGCSGRRSPPPRLGRGAKRWRPPPPPPLTHPVPPEMTCLPRPNGDSTAGRPVPPPGGGGTRGQRRVNCGGRRGTLAPSPRPPAFVLASLSYPKKSCRGAGEGWEGSGTLAVPLALRKKMAPPHAGHRGTGRSLRVPKECDGHRPMRAPRYCRVGQD